MITSAKNLFLMQRTCVWGQYMRKQKSSFFLLISVRILLHSQLICFLFESKFPNLQFLCELYCFSTFCLHIETKDQVFLMPFCIFGCFTNYKYVRLLSFAFKCTENKSFCCFTLQVQRSLWSSPEALRWRVVDSDLHIMSKKAGCTRSRHHSCDVSTCKIFVI